MGIELEVVADERAAAHRGAELIAAAGLAWMMLSTPPQRVLFQGLADADKAAVTASLTQAGIASHVDDASGNVTVDDDKYSRARMLLASQNLPHAAPGGYAILDQLPMGVSRAVEGERLRQARESELAQSIADALARMLHDRSVDVRFLSSDHAICESLLLDTDPRAEARALERLRALLDIAVAQRIIGHRK